MKSRLKRILGIYIFGTILSTFCSFLYFYQQTSLTFILIFLLVFLISYSMPFWFQLFFKIKSYDGKYRKQLSSFANLHGFNLKDIYVLKSSRSNACSFGLFNNKSVTFNSNILEKHPYDEIEGVMAHELGHHANFGIYIYTALIAIILNMLAVINIILYQYFIGNLLIICLITSALILPFVLMISRFMENQADRYAISILKKPSSFGRFLERMLKFDYKMGDSWSKNPSLLLRIFSIHPWIYDRIKLTETK